VAVYDAGGGAPTGGALALGEQLRAASAEYDARVFADGNAGAAATPAPVREGARENAGANTGAAAGGEGAAAREAVLISFNPIVRLEWVEPESVYAQTAYVRFFRNEPLPTFKYARWHLVRLYPQAVVVKS
jgi:hypothetical protein